MPCAPCFRLNTHIPLQLSLIARVVGENLVTVPYLCAPPPGAPPPPGVGGMRLRLRDPDPGAAALTVDLFLDSYRRRLPPGCAPGALVQFVGLRTGVSRGTAYLSADGACTVRVLRAPPVGEASATVSADVCASDAEAAWGQPRRPLRCLHPAPPGAPPGAPGAVALGEPHLFCGRVAALCSATLRLACGRCNGDAWAGEQPCLPTCRFCGFSVPPRLLLSAVVRLEDGGAAAECRSEGEAARLLLGLRPGELQALARRHCHLELKPASFEWSDAGGGSFAAQRGAIAAVDATGAPVPHSELWEVRAALRTLRAQSGPLLLVWAARCGSDLSTPLTKKYALPGGRELATSVRALPQLRALAVRETTAREEAAVRLAQ